MPPTRGKVYLFIYDVWFLVLFLNKVFENKNPQFIYKLKEKSLLFTSKYNFICIFFLDAFHCLLPNLRVVIPLQYMGIETIPKQQYYLFWSPIDTFTITFFNKYLKNIYFRVGIVGYFSDATWGI